MVTFGVLVSCFLLQLCDISFVGYNRKLFGMNERENVNDNGGGEKVSGSVV